MLRNIVVIVKKNKKQITNEKKNNTASVLLSPDWQKKNMLQAWRIFQLKYFSLKVLLNVMKKMESLSPCTQIYRLIHDYFTNCHETGLGMHDWQRVTLIHQSMDYEHNMLPLHHSAIPVSLNHCTCLCIWALTKIMNGNLCRILI